MGALVSCVGEKTHGDVYLTAVDVLLCIDVYIKKWVKEEVGKRMVVAESEWKSGNPVFPRYTERSRHRVIHSPGRKYVANLHVSHRMIDLSLDKDTRYSSIDPNVMICLWR